MPATCDLVCRNHPDYALRVRETKTFALDTVPRAAVLASPTLLNVVPVLYHGNSRARPFQYPMVALSLYAMFNRAQGTGRFITHEALCNKFTIKTGTGIILTGTDRDRPLERWWGLEAPQRRALIRTFKDLGVVLVTSPNYSLFTDVPRWTDLHSIKRIAITHNEFIDEGIPAALHVNGRTETDFREWTNYIRHRPEIAHLAYEFTTGTRWPGRREQHARWLRDLAVKVERPLKLLLRGGSEVLPILATSFSTITLLDTTVFMKTMMRQRAVKSPSEGLAWKADPTPQGAPLDELLHHNVIQVTTSSSLAQSA